MMDKRVTGAWTMYRKPKDSGLWLRFQLLCVTLGLSQSSAVTRAVAAWVEQNDPDEKHRMPWAEQ